MIKCLYRPVSSGRAILFLPLWPVFISLPECCFSIQSGYFSKKIKLVPIVKKKDLSDETSDSACLISYFKYDGQNESEIRATYILEKEEIDEK